MATRLRAGRWDVQGHQLGMPVHIRDAAFAGATFRAPRRAVDDLVEPLGFRSTGFRGAGLALLMCVQYRDFDLGGYDEIGLAVFAGPPGRAPGMVTIDLPVTQAFTLEAGREIWGLPKWLMTSTLDLGGSSSAVSVSDGDVVVMDGAITTGRRALPIAAPFVVPTWARAEDGPYAGGLLRGKASMTARGLRVGRGRCDIAWGDHPMADRARALGMDRRPSMTFAASRLTGSLGESKVVD